MNWLYLENWSLAAGAFDFDWNVLKMSTTYKFLQKSKWKIVEILATEVDQNPEKYWGNDDYTYVNGYINETFSNFSDSSWFNERWFNWLIEDIEKSLENWNFSPSFEPFKNIFLIKWRIFSIITARWSSPDNFKIALRMINDVIFSNEEKKEQEECIRDNFWYSKSKYSKEQVNELYFRDQIVDYVPCNNPLIQRMMNIWWECKTNIKAQVMNWWIIEIHRKLIEIWKRFNKKIDDIITPETPLSIWFSDDAISNIQGMTEYFSHKIPYLWEKYKWRIFYTWHKWKIPTIKSKLPDNAYTKSNDENFEIRFS